MNDIKQNIANNITELRKSRKWTQLDLANKLNGGTFSLGATVMFVKDAALMIKVVPYATEPECRLIEERIV